MILFRDSHEITVTYFSDTNFPHLHFPLIIWTVRHHFALGHGLGLDIVKGTEITQNKWAASTLSRIQIGYFGRFSKRYIELTL